MEIFESMHLIEVSKEDFQWAYPNQRVSSNC